MSSCTQSSPSASGVAAVSGSRGEHRAAQRLGRVAVVDAVELHEPLALVPARRAIDERDGRRRAARAPGANALGPVGHERDR